MSESAAVFHLIYRLSLQQYRDATFLALRLSRAQQQFFIGALLISAILAIVNPADIQSFAVAALFGIISVIVLRVFMQPRQAIRQYARQPSAAPLNVEGKEDGLRLYGEGFEGLLPWQRLIRWRHDDDFLILYPTSKSYYIVPLDELSPDQKNWLFEKLTAQLGQAT